MKSGSRLDRLLPLSLQTWLRRGRGWAVAGAAAIAVGWMMLGLVAGWIAAALVGLFVLIPLSLIWHSLIPIVTRKPRCDICGSVPLGRGRWTKYRGTPRDDDDAGRVYYLCDGCEMEADW